MDQTCIGPWTLLPGHKFGVRRHTTEQQLERCEVGPDAFPRAVRCVFDTHTGVAPSMFPRGAMPMLQDLTFMLQPKHSVHDLGLGHLPSLPRVTALGLDYFRFLDDDEAITRKVVSSVREKLEHEAALHPNHPTIICWARYIFLVSSVPYLPYF